MGNTLIPASHVSVTVETIGPDLARQYLARNQNNRPLSTTRVAQYASDMRSGSWMLTHQGICFDDGGVLIDGQHRLHALIESGASATFQVTRGAAHQSFGVIDRPHYRRSGQILSVEGVKNPNIVAAATTLLGSYILHPKSVGLGGWSRTLTGSEFLATFNVNRGIVESVAKVSSLGLKKLGEESVFAFCHYVFAAEDSEKAASFFDILASGVGLTNRHPVYMLRERLIAGKSRSTKMKRGFKISLIFKAFRAYLDGRELGVLKLLEGEPLLHNETVREMLLARSGLD